MAAATALLGASCAGGGGGSEQKRFRPGLVNPELGPCTSVPPPGPPMTWLPADLPLPRGAYALREVPPPGGDPTTYRRGFWVVPTSLEKFVDFVLRQWPKHGWTLGAGEQEPGEAEDAFLRGDFNGSFRARSSYCDTTKSEVYIVYGSTAPGATTVPPAASTSEQPPPPG